MKSNLDVDIMLTATELNEIIMCSREHWRELDLVSFTQDDVDYFVLYKFMNDDLFVVLHIVEHGDDSGAVYYTEQEARSAFERECKEYSES